MAGNGNLDQQFFSLFQGMNQVLSALVQKTGTIPILPSYTVAQATSLTGIATGTMIYVTNETGGAVPAFYDGTNFRRVTDRNVIS